MRPGQSGSPLYQYVEQKATIAGIHLAACVPGSINCKKHIPEGQPGRNWMRAITPNMVSAINEFVLANPPP